MRLSILLATVLLTASNAYCSVPVGILGQWNTDGGDSKLELFKCGEKICGRIVWLKVPAFIDSKDGPVGKAKVDLKNPDPRLRNQPIIGLQVMKGMTVKTDKLWENGICYDPETGRSYKCKMQLASPVRLNLRGYIGISLIGRNFGLSR
jgi:uncharacterized protein (DUF2147 family)